jgi:hypothetical protein
MPKKKTGDMNEAMREWASAELGGETVTNLEARHIVDQYHYDGVAGFERNYNTEYPERP